VSCTEATACTAVGSFSNGTTHSPLVEGWNGTTWSVRSPGLPAVSVDAELDGVSCAGATACTAVGTADENAALAESWDGTSWAPTSIPMPATATQSSLAQVSCPSIRVCTAVGSWESGTGPVLTLGLRSS
jgi:hypothetical protein